MFKVLRSEVWESEGICRRDDVVSHWLISASSVGVYLMLLIAAMVPRREAGLRIRRVNARVKYNVAAGMWISERIK